MNRPVSEIDAYLEGTLTAEQAQTLEAWINASPDHAAEFLFLIQTHQTLGIIGKESQLARHAAEVKPDQLDRVTLAALAEMEASAETITLPIQDFIRFDQPEADDDAGSLSAHDLVAAGSYLFRHSFTPKVVAAVAAVLIVGITLLIVLSGDTPAPPIVEDRSEPNRADPTVEPPVATLTAEHEAVWSLNLGESLRPGSALASGQRLTLTAGLAEITTHRGAIAILQAPATIELTNHDNALRLHTGRLVGICETESSKGFLVHTPHLHITDLGTRFGIDASADATEVHVFEGKVQAERVAAPADAQPVTLVAHMSARTSANTDVIVRIDHDADRFAALLPTTIELPGTGFGLAVGDTDPNWQIVAIDGKPLDTPQTVRVYNFPGYTRDVPNNPASAQWVGMLPTQHAQPGDWITYRFQTRVTLPESMDPEASQLGLSYTADNYVRAILVNGQRIEMDDAVDEGRWTVRNIVIDEHLAAGENTIAFEVENHTFPDTLGAGQLSLYVRWAWQQPALTP